MDFPPNALPGTSEQEDECISTIIISLLKSRPSIRLRVAEAMISELNQFTEAKLREYKNKIINDLKKEQISRLIEEATESDYSQNNDRGEKRNGGVDPIPRKKDALPLREGQIAETGDEKENEIV